MPGSEMLTMLVLISEVPDHLISWEAVLEAGIRILQVPDLVVQR